MTLPIDDKVFPNTPALPLSDAVHAYIESDVCNKESADKLGKEWKAYEDMEPPDGDDDRTFHVYGVVYADRARALAEFLKAAGGEDITVRLNSPGGDYAAGIAMANRLAEYGGAVTTVVDGMAASAAGLVFLAGDKREMKDGSLCMLHNVWLVAIGNQYDMGRACENLKEIDRAMVDFLAKRLSIKRAEIVSLLKEEKFMSAASVKKIGGLSAEKAAKKSKASAADDDKKAAAAAEADERLNAEIRRRLGMA